MKYDSVLFVNCLDHISELSAENTLERSRLRTDNVDVEAARAQRCRGFKPNEACADNDGALGVLRFGDQRAAIIQCAEIVDMWESRAGNIEANRRRACRQKQSVERHAASVCKRNLALH